MKVRNIENVSFRECTCVRCDKEEEEKEGKNIFLPFYRGTRA